MIIGFITQSTNLPQSWDITWELRLAWSSLIDPSDKIMSNYSWGSNSENVGKGHKCEDLLARYLLKNWGKIHYCAIEAEKSSLSNLGVSFGTVFSWVLALNVICVESQSWVTKGESKSSQDGQILSQNLSPAGLSLSPSPDGRLRVQSDTKVSDQVIDSSEHISASMAQLLPKSLYI